MLIHTCISFFSFLYIIPKIARPAAAIKTPAPVAWTPAAALGLSDGDEPPADEEGEDEEPPFAMVPPKTMAPSPAVPSVAAAAFL